MKIEKNLIAGVLSAIMLFIEITGVSLLLLQGTFVFGIFDILIIIGLCYLIYKTLIKKQNLIKWEWLVFGIILALFIISFLAGFFIGISEV